MLIQLYIYIYSKELILWKVVCIYGPSRGGEPGWNRRSNPLHTLLNGVLKVQCWFVYAPYIKIN